MTTFIDTLKKHSPYQEFFLYNDKYKNARGVNSKRTFERNKEWIKSLNAHTILDVGTPGIESCEYFLSLGYDTTFLDLIDRRKKDCNIPFIQHDISKIPWPINKKFDLIICSHILEHLFKDDIKKALTEIDRLACNCIVTVPYFRCEDHFTVEDDKWWLSFLNKNSKFKWEITNVIKQYNNCVTNIDLITVGTHDS
jgi:SAM-dependent methyltransferase